MAKIYENLRIIEHPNPILNTPSRPVNQITEDLKNLVSEMFKLMYENEGVGLSAPQVGILKKIFIMDSDGQRPFVFINPKILKSIGKLEPMQEGCLSFPGLFGQVVRTPEIVVRFLDLDGRKQKRRFSGLESQIIQHEIDHLLGSTFDKRLIDGSIVRYST